MPSKLLLLTLLTAVSVFNFFSQNAFADQPSMTSCSLSSQAIEKAVLNLLDKNPKIVLTALKKAVEQEEKEKLLTQERLIQSHKADLLKAHAFLPTSGNSNGDIKIVAFFDYQCGYCKKSEQTLADALKKDPNIQIIYKEMPIFGKDSEILAQMALSSHLQGKYACLHHSFMTHKGPLTESVGLDLAKKCDVDPVKLQKDMNSESIKKVVSQNKQLAETLQIEAAPFFIVGEKIVPGYLSPETLQKTISEQRRPSKLALSSESAT
ncbi:MAG: DsbA family protein [Proteobacteria bacterium]|nr:DsbA family protein [Pseudomonadota bacterium]